MGHVYYCALIVRDATGVVESKNWASGIFLWMARGRNEKGERGDT